MLILANEPMRLTSRLGVQDAVRFPAQVLSSVYRAVDHRHNRRQGGAAF